MSKIRATALLLIVVVAAGGAAFLLLRDPRPSLVVRDDVTVSEVGGVVDEAGDGVAAKGAPYAAAPADVGDDEDSVFGRRVSSSQSIPGHDAVPLNVSVAELDALYAIDVNVSAQQSTSGMRVIVTTHRATNPPGTPPGAPPPAMPGALDDTWYTNRVAIGTEIAVPLTTSAAGRRLRIVFGILASPNTLRSRVFPQLLTSLRHERSYVFIERNDTIPAFGRAAASARKFIARYNLTAEVVHLDTISEMKMSQRNSWMDLPVLRWMAHRHRVNSSAATDIDWYAIVDDDTYVLSAATREVLSRYGNRTGPVVLADMLRWGEGGGWRLVRMRDGQRKFIPSTKRQPITFPCGGGGIFMNAAAVRKALPALPACIEKHFHPAGDLRLGACFADIRMPLTRRREFVKDVHFRAIGDLQLYRQFAFPAAFHRLREIAWYTELRQLEAERGRWGLVHWEDLQRAFPIGSRGHYRSLYHPADYENCTAIFGVRPTPKPYNPKIKWGKKGLPPLPPSRGNPQADEWGGCKLPGPTSRPPIARPR